MKKIFFTLLAFVGTMNMNAQVTQVMNIKKNGVVVATFKADQADEVEFKEVTIPTTGTAKATINGSEVDVNWVQLWENGPKFAEYNVGVTDGKAESYGGYYTWGGKYKNEIGIAWNGSSNYSSDALTGTDDTANYFWGENWRMPTKAEFEGLLNSDNCDVEWTNDYNGTGIIGIIFTGKNEYSSNSVFLPVAGCCIAGGFQNQDKFGYYWASTINASDHKGDFLYFRSDLQIVGTYDRSNAHSVRAVLVEE